MRIDELLNYYKQLTFYSRVTKKTEKLSFLIFLIGATLYAVLSYNALYNKNFWLIILAILCLVLSLYAQAYLITRTLKDTFPEILISNINWDRKKFNDLIYEDFSKKLTKEKLNTNLDLIQKTISERALKEKVSYIVIISIFSALFVPLWSSYASEILKACNNSIIGLNIVFLLLSISILGISIIGYFMADIRDGFLTDYKKLIKLNDLITDYRIKEKL